MAIDDVAGGRVVSQHI